MAEVVPCILIVEDEPADAYAARFLLERLVENPVWTVSNCREAADFLDCTNEWSGRPPLNPALILLDIRIPGVPAHQFVKVCRATPKIAEIQIWVLTQYPDEPLVRKAIAEGADALMQKPMALEMFLEIVEKAKPKDVRVRNTTGKSK